MGAEIDAIVGRRIELFGPSLEYLTSPHDAAVFCVLTGVIPPGVSVPLHSHADVEDFCVISARALTVKQATDGYELITCGLKASSAFGARCGMDGAT